MSDSWLPQKPCLRPGTVVAAVLLGLLAFSGCGDRATPVAGGPPSHARGSDPSSALPTETIIAFCADCHVMPQATSFPKSAWRAEVQRGYDFYYASGRTDLEVPVQADVLEFFVSQAPESLASGTPQLPSAEWNDRFEIEPIHIPGVAAAAISFVDRVNLDPPFADALVLSDMRGGGVYLAAVDQGQVGTPVQVGSVHNPAVVRATDWDRDGAIDLIVADLGSLLPADHDQGQVVWLRRDPDSDQFQPQPLCTGIGRVASVEVGDFTGDQRDDLLVAEFGWHTTGSIFLARRTESSGDEKSDPTPPQSKDGGPLMAHDLQYQPIDSRPGTIHVPPVDFDQDGDLDLIALVSQEYESIEAYENDGEGTFTRRRLFQAPDPSFGSSGIELTDLDKDGRVDVLYTNGDAFDSFVIKPFHSVHWLRGLPDGSFEPQRLGALPGAHRAVASDLTGDRRPDIVAGAFLPRELLRSTSYQQAESLVVWEQTDDQQFDRHVLETGNAIHATLLLTDLEGDGDEEIVVANFREPGVEEGPALTIWRTTGQ